MLDSFGKLSGLCLVKGNGVDTEEASSLTAAIQSQ